VEVVGVSEISECCQPRDAVAACCEATVDGAEWQVGGDAASERLDEGAVSIVESQPEPVGEPESAGQSEPTLAGAATLPPELEPVAAPPALEPAGAVTPASNEQPLADLPAGSAGSPPAAASVLTEPEMPADGEPRGAGAAEAAVEPVTPPAEEPAPAAGEVPMVDEADADEPAVEPELPAGKKPAPAVEPEPEPGNIFEELDAETESAAAADEEAMQEEPAVDPFAGEPTEPATTAADAAEPDAEPAESDPFAATEPAVSGGEEAEEMVDEAAEPAAAPDEPVDPFAADAAAGSEEPVAAEEESEPAAEDPFAAVEPPRRWIDATGTGSIVATLVDATAAGECVLEIRGRRVVVPLENLSGHDRDYVRRAGLRLATGNGQESGQTATAAPAPGDTAGL
jgi:hypothetical protein